MTAPVPVMSGIQGPMLPSARIYLDYYHLFQAPFAITPDPEFLFSAGGHQEALEKIAYAIGSRMGFILLTGEVGTGKTTVCRTLLDRLNGRAETVYLINPSLSGRELLSAILEDAGIAPDVDAPKKALVDLLNRHLLSTAGDRPFVVIIDDAQTMSPEALEDLRLLSNLETDKHKLIQVVLSGQPELLDLLDIDRLRQLRQRIALHCRLAELSAEETGGYISQRLFVAGNQGQVHFSTAAVRQIHRRSGGVPRMINNICDYALTAGYVKDASIIESTHVRQAWAELTGLDSLVTRQHARGLAAAIALLFLSGVAAWAYRDSDRFPWQPAIQALGQPVAASAYQPGAASPIRDALPGTATDTPPLDTTPAATETGGEASNDRPTDSATLDGPANQAAPQPSAARYALQLGSFRTQDQAQRSAGQLRESGIPAHWQRVDEGRWYRVIAGRFGTPAEARLYQNANRLGKAIVINAPLTVRVLPGQPGVTAAEISGFLAQIGHDCLMETGPTGDNEIYTGLYTSIEDAATVAGGISTGGRILAQVVQR